MMAAGHQFVVFVLPWFKSELLLNNLSRRKQQQAKPFSFGAARCDDIFGHPIVEQPSLSSVSLLKVVDDKPLNSSFKYIYLVGFGARCSFGARAACCVFCILQSGGTGGLNTLEWKLLLHHLHRTALASHFHHRAKCVPPCVVLGCSAPVRTVPRG